MTGGEIRSGRIDNFYAAFGKPRHRVTEHDLHAIDAVLATGGAESGDEPRLLHRRPGCAEEDQRKQAEELTMRKHLFVGSGRGVLGGVIGHSQVRGGGRGAGSPAVP